MNKTVMQLIDIKRARKAPPAPPSNIIPLAQHGLPRTPRTVALARLLATIAQNIPAKAA